MLGGRCGLLGRFGEVAGVRAGTPLYLRYNAWLRKYYEFESIIGRWLLLHPELTDHAFPNCVLIDRAEGLAISQQGWEQFVSWLVMVVRDRLDAMEAGGGDTKWWLWRLVTVSGFPKI